MKEFMRMMRRYIAPFKKYLWGSVVLNILSAVFNIFSFAMIVPMLRILFRMTDKTYVFTPWNKVWHMPLKDMGNSLMQNVYYALESNIAQYGEIKVLLALCIFLIVMTALKDRHSEKPQDEDLQQDPLPAPRFLLRGKEGGHHSQNER